MSFILEPLFGPVLIGAPSHKRALRSDDGILLHLVANAQDDELGLMSSPGCLTGADTDAEPASCQHLVIHPTLDGMRCALLAHATDVSSRQLHLVDVWSRHAVQAHRLQEWLDDHTRRHRLWLQTLTHKRPYHL